MKLKFFCPYWGSEALAFKDFCSKVKEVGYDGVEVSLEPENQVQKLEVLDALAEQGLELIAQTWQNLAMDVDVYEAEYLRQLKWLSSCGALFINAQTGRDWYSFEDNLRLIRAAAQVEAETGVPVIHEMHRGKFGFAAGITARFLEGFPDIRLTADFSHWCNVSESLLEGQEAPVELASQHANHIHARVGFQEGPQVPDFRAPEYEDALNAHLGWWDRIVQCHLEAGHSSLTITPEFGPFPYMPSMPHSMEPVANQWELNVAMMNQLRERYADRCEV